MFISTRKNKQKNNNITLISLLKGQSDSSKGNLFFHAFHLRAIHCIDSTVKMYFNLAWLYSNFHISIIFSPSKMNEIINLLKCIFKKNLISKTPGKNLPVLMLHERTIFTAHYLYHILTLSLHCKLYIMYMWKLYHSSNNDIIL